MGPATYSKMVTALAYIRNKRDGATTADLMAKLECSRSTVERVLEALRDAEFELEERKLPTDNHRVKRWHITKKGMLSNPAASQLLALSLDQRLALETAYRSSTNPALRDALSKVLAFQSALPRAREMDLEELVSRDMRASTVGPKQRIDIKTIETLREALVGGTCVRIRYSGGSERLVAPHGIIHSRFHYLVARSEAGIVQTFRLDLISSIGIDNQLAEEPEDWSLSKWAQESFGIYHGDHPINVILEFDPEVSDRAEKLIFHPSQWQQRQPNGALRVQLRCCGHRELLHEILHPDWLGHVTVLGPQELVKELAEFLRITQNRHGIS